MLKIRNLRLGKGIALINRKKMMVIGGGTKSFIHTLMVEVGWVPHLMDGYCGDPTCSCNDD